MEKVGMGLRFWILHGEGGFSSVSQAQLAGNGKSRSHRFKKWGVGTEKVGGRQIESGAGRERV